MPLVSDILEHFPHSRSGGILPPRRKPLRRLEATTTEHATPIAKMR